MIANIVIPSDSPVYATFQQLIAERKLVFLAGIPGVGKSLLLQQLALMAMQAGREVHLLQWDVTRAAFETDAVLAKYPEVDGVTHAAIRKAVGLWAREGVQAWVQSHPGAMLVGEVPLIGNRLIELVQRRDDAAEALLSGDQTAFVVPVPTLEVRQVIEAARSQSISQPQHNREAYDAPPNVLQAIWGEVHGLAVTLGLAQASETQPTPYDPDVYAGVFAHLLQHRRTIRVDIATVFERSGSVYDLDGIAGEVAADPATVTRIMAQVESNYTPAQLGAAVNDWWRV